MVIAKIKPILPSLREKKRYLAFEIVAEKSIDNADSINKAIQTAVKNYIGEKGINKAGIMFLADKYSNNKGIIRLNRKSLDDVKFALLTIREINNIKTTFSTKGVSGMLNKAYNDYVLK